MKDGYSSVHGRMLARTKQGGPPAIQYSATTVEESC